MRREEIRSRILEALNESAEDPTFWSTDEINRIIGEGMEVLAEEANSIKRTAYIPFREGHTYYYTQSIAKDMMVPYRVWHASLDRRLRPVTTQDLDRFTETWTTVTGDSWCWFIVAWNLFGVFPRAANAGGVMRVDYLAWPREIQDDDEEPEFPEADHEEILLYGIYDGLLKQWDLARAITVFGKFVDLLPGGRYRKATELKASDMTRAVDGLRDFRVDRIYRD